LTLLSPFHLPFLSRSSGADRTTDAFYSLYANNVAVCDAPVDFAASADFFRFDDFSGFDDRFYVPSFPLHRFFSFATSIVGVSLLFYRFSLFFSIGASFSSRAVKIFPLSRIKKLRRLNR